MVSVVEAIDLKQATSDLNQMLTEFAAGIDLKDGSA